MARTHLISVGLSGVLVFAATALGGVIWQYNSSKTAPTKNSQQDQGKISIPGPPPKGVTFVLNGRNYWVLKHKYLRDDAEKMNTQLSALQDLFGNDIADIHREIDLFLRGWPANSIGGKQKIITQLTDLRQRLRVDAQKYMDILEQRPSLRSDLQDIIQDNGSVGLLNGALNDYIETMQFLPDTADQPAIQRLLSNEHAKLKKANEEFLKFIQNFTVSRVPTARGELQTFV